MAENSYNLEALGLEDEVRRDVKKALTFGNVDPAQLEYFKKVNKEALSQPLPPPPPPPPPTAVESVEQTIDLPGGATAQVKQETLDETLERLYGSPEMRGHIK